MLFLEMTEDGSEGGRRVDNFEVVISTAEG